MAAVFSIALPVIAIACFVIALLFGLRAFQSRSQRQSNPYGVGRQEARLSMRLDLLRALAALLVGVIMLAILLFIEVGTADGNEPPLVDAPPAATNTTVAPSADSPTATATLVMAVTATPDSVEPTATAPPATNTPSPTATATATPEPATAVVSSGVGVWLRADPDPEAEQIEWVLQGTELALRDGLEEGELYDWQEVTTPAGNSGWVATEFITYVSQP